MMRMLSFLIIAALAEGAEFAAGAAGNPAGASAKEPFSLELLIDREEVWPGSDFRLAVLVTLEAGWYVYANPMGPGIGQPTVVEGVSQPGFAFGPAKYLPGSRKDQGDITPGAWVSTYEGSVPIYLEVRTAADVRPGTYRLAVKVEGQACREPCIPFSRELSLEVKVGEAGGEVRRINASAFAGFDKAKPGVARPAEAEPEKPGPEEEGAEIDVSRYEARTLPGEARVTGLLMAVILGFVAGLLLNVMPCVLPVISIKIMSLISQAHEERGRILRLGLAFAAGLILVFLILATLAAAAGHSWGDHFRSEAFIVVMLGVVFVFALGMFDIYIILVPSGAGSGGAREGYIGSFLKGILTTFLATPCSGPFLGATLAWALTQAPLTIFTVFTSVGLGMASPYLLLSAFPGLLRFVPRPGPWMETFKNLMGFVLLGTVVYLFTILRSELVIPTLAFCLVLALGAYLWGRYAHGAVPNVKRWAWRAAILAIAASGAYLCYAPSGKAEVAWEPFSMAALDLYGLEGRTVVVDFTSKFCPNCKFVEKTVLETEAIQAAFKEKGAALVKADTTRSAGDSPVMRLMKQLGGSIPFLAIFPGDDPLRPYTLRDIYFKKDVLAILQRCPDA